MTVLAFPVPHDAPLALRAFGPQEPSLDDMMRTGATYRKIDYWSRSGRLSHTERVGSGYARHWTARDWRMVYMMTRLVDTGLSLVLAHDLAARAERGDWTYEAPDGVRIEWKVTW